MSLVTASAASAGYYNAVVAVNGHLDALRFYSINPDCTLLGYADVRVTQAPEHGSLVIKKGTAYPSFPASNPRSACASRRVPAVVVEYRPMRAYSGPDSFGVEAITPSGSDSQNTVNITVK